MRRLRTLAVLQLLLLAAGAATASVAPRDTGLAEDEERPSVGAPAGLRSEQQTRIGRIDKRTDQGAYYWIAAPTCCPGCSYSAGCCCQPAAGGRAQTRVVTVTARRQARAASRDSELRSSLGALELEEEISDTATQQSFGTHSLHARHLCPVCPAGATVAQRSLWNRMVASFGSPSYCCPSQQGGPLTRTVTRTQTQTAVEPTSPAGKALWSGAIFYDNNGDGKYSAAGVDKLAANQWIIFRNAAGKILGRTKTDAKGRFSYSSSAYRNARITVALLKAPSSPILTFKTDSRGNSRFSVPVAPPRVRGSLFKDTNNNGKRDPGEAPLANSFVIIKFATNGTIWKRVPTDAQGRYSFPYGGKMGKRYPFLQLTIVGPDGKTITGLRLDGNGDGMREIGVVTVAAKPHIKGELFYDANGNGIRDAGEQPSANQVVFIKRKDGTLIKRITTNAAGKFDFQTAAGAYPNELLYVYDSKGNLIGRFTTKKDGSGSVVCALAANPSPPSPPPPPPLPPPPLPPSTAILSGSVWLDADGNDILDAGEPTLANTDLEIRWPNGTVLKRVTLDAGGSFRVDVAKYPGQSFGLFLPDGRQIGSLATDADGNANTDVPLSNSARMGGVVFVDLNKDGVMDPTDLPVANSEIDVRFPNGTLVGRVQTDSGGRFSLIMLEQTYPGVKFVVSSSATGKVLQTFTTDQAGNSDTKIPLPPSTALIQGTAFFDNNGDSTLNAGDVPAPDTTLVIRFANGSEFVRIRTTADGEFGFPMPASPGTTFGVYTTGGQQLSTFTTDDKGNAITKVPISGPAGEIKGQVFIDMDQNGEFNPTKDALLAENRVVLRFPNGTIFQTVPIDALGRFDAVAVGKIFPNTVFGITTVSGSPVGTLRTDSSGNAAVLIPVAPATIDGDIWTDANTNNVHDPTEAALANTFVDIKLSNGTLVARVPTNSTGGFVLSTIPYPNQQLSLFGPDGNLLKTFTTSSKGDATVTVPVHQPSSTVSGAAFVDANGNGVRDPGELPFANQSLVLRFPNGTLLATVITNTTGGFGSNVATAPNTLLVVSSPDGRILQTFKTDNAGNAQLLVAIEQKSTIQGSIFTDLNGNGVRDPSEVAFAGPYVDLAFSNNGSIIARVPVNAAGNFTFPSNSSYANTPISIFSPNGSLLQNFTADRTGGASVVVPLAPPPEIIPPGVIQGILCSDIGVDGKCDPSDPPLSNSFVTIRWPNSSVLAQVPTNSTGGYSLSIGPYPSTQFTVEGPTGSPKVPFTTDGLGNGGAMVAVAPTIPTTTSKTATPTASTLAHIQGQVFIDANSNGANDPGESSYANQPLVISWPNGTQLATVTTDLSGKFDLPTAPYPGAQFILSSQDGSFARPFTTDAQGGAVLLVPLQPVLPPTKTTTIAPTSTPGGFIQGFVCIDAAGDGMCGPGDQPLPNSLVTIRYLNGTVLAQTTTNSTGGFSVPVAVPPFQQLSVDGFGGQAPMFFQVDGAGAAVLSVARPPVLSTTKTTRPATLTATATVGRIITGFVWSDLNNDLQPGASEPRLPNYGLVIKFANGSLLTTTTTDSTGAFVIPSLGYYPSETFVVESQSGQPLATFVTDSQGSATVLVAAPAPMSSTRTDTRSMSQTPVSTPTIAGTVQGAACIDISGNGLCDPSDPPLANSFVIISWPNGTVLANLPTNATGGYSLPFVLYANQAFTISGPTGSPTVSFSTDAFGSAAPNVPIPPSAPTPTFTSSLATPTSPIPLGSIQGQVCLDANADGACQPSESAFGNSYVVVRFANGSLLATVPTNATGGYILPLPAYPFQPYTVEGPQGQPVVPFTTDVFGNARADVAISNVASTSLSIPGSRTTTASMSSVIGTTGTVKVSTTSTPLPAGQIAGLACLDIQEDGVCDSSDLPLANSTLLLKYPNGTVLAPIPTNSSGQFSYPAGLLPNQPYVLEAPSGFQVSFQTSQSGGAFVNMPIRLPGASTPTTLTSSAFSETSTTVPGATTGPATETPTSTASETSISATPTQTALAFLTGTCFFDVDKDGVFTSGIDRPIGNETVVLLFSNGSVYDYGTTMSNGTFVISGTPAPNEALTVVLASDPTAAGATITTDADGNGSANVAVLPPTILGSLFFDMDGDGSFTASDTVIGLEPLLLLFPNGSTYASVTTLADGSFTLDPALPAAANVNLTVVRASKPGVPLANFVTDSTGSGQVDVALAPPSISGQVWLDLNGNSLFNIATEKALANQALELHFANGTTYTSLVTDLTGNFSAVPAVPAPGETLLLYDPATGLYYGNLTLDMNGSGYANFPVPPPRINGSIFYDTNGDGVRTTGEAPYSSKPVQIRLQNGTVLANLTTDALGNINGALDGIFPGQPFDIVDPVTGAALGSGATDNQGNILGANVPLLVTTTTATETTTKSATTTSESATSTSKSATTTSESLTTTSKSETTTSESATSTSKTASTTSETTTFTETTTSWSQTTTETSSTTSATETLTTTTTPVAHISGYFCQDTSRDGVCDSGEAPISNSTIVLTWTNGTVFETVVTNSSGMFEFTSPPYPGEVLLVQGPAGTPAATNITLDSSGSGHADVPVLPARVQGSIYYDVDNSSSLTSGDVPLNGTNVLLLLPNGTVYANLTTSSNGSFVYDTLDPVYNTNLSVVLASDPNTVLQTITTDAAGSANADVPVPVPTPVIKAQLWVDTNNNGVWDPDEVPYKAKGVYLLLPDNSTVPGTMDSLGQFSFNVSNSSLPNTPLQIYDSATNQVLSNFTTDSTSSANVAVPIPVPLTYPGVTIGSNASSNCLPTGQPYTAAVTAPLESSSNGTQSMQVDFTAGTSYTGPVKAPYGWTTEYSIDGGKTWNTTEPAPASLVTNLRTTSPKPLSSGTPSNSTNGTTYRYSSTVLVKAKPGTLAAMVNIDAYDLIFDKINDRVFFYAHHQYYLGLDCRMLSTGQQCVGYNFGYDVTGNNPQRSKFVAYSSSYVCTGFYHPMDGFLYLWASWNTLQSSWTPTVPTATQPLYGVPVLVCVDVRNLTGPPKSCPTPHYYMSGVILDLGSAPTLFSINHAVWMPSVNRYYMLEAQSKLLHCFDWTTKANCTGGYPKLLDVTGPWWGGMLEYTWATRFNIIKVSSSIIVYRTSSMIYCTNVVTEQQCSGSWPYNMTAKGIPEDTWPITLHMSSRYSQVDGVCFYWGCLDLQANNRSEWLPSSISSYFYRRGGNAITSYNNFFAKYSTTPMGHVWWYTPNPSFSRYECYDWITSAPCNIPVVTPTYDNSAYMTRQDPDNPYCIYYDFDTGAVGSFDARTGKVGCTGTGLSEFRMTGTETTTCSGKSVVATRESLTVVRVINGTAANMVLSVLNDDGAAVPGFVDVNVTIGTPVSLLGLTPNISGSNPSFNLNGDYSSTAVLEILFQYEARTMELCFNATTASSNATTAVPFTVTSYGNGTAEPIYPNSDTALDVCPA